MRLLFVSLVTKLIATYSNRNGDADLLPFQIVTSVNHKRSWRVLIARLTRFAHTCSLGVARIALEEEMSLFEGKLNPYCQCAAQSRLTYSLSASDRTEYWPRVELYLICITFKSNDQNEQKKKRWIWHLDILTSDIDNRFNRSKPIPTACKSWKYLCL